ncbi:MAG: DUF362 domain-containing protein [bacterium]|nr:DUF362 domain-containing protein [bacterium]
MVKIITRRDFMKGSTCAVLGAAIGLPVKQTQKSRVVLIRNKDVLDESSNINQEIVGQMIDEAAAALFNKDSGLEAFKSIIKPGETVGIKSNVWTYLPTPTELEKVLKKRVTDCGVDESKIGIDDHGVKANPIFQNATSLINVRPLRTHYLSGVSGTMKNLIMFSDSQSKWHPNSCADLGLLLNEKLVKGKVRLHVLCALTPQFHGRGPHHFSRRYVWKYNGLILGTDPVAVDSTGLSLIMAKRREVLGRAKELPPVPKHIRTADVKHGLGNSDPKNIDLIKLGWDNDIMI